MPLAPPPDAAMVFTFPETDQSVRSVTVNDAPWWVARDVADILGLSNMHSSLALLDEDEKGVHSVETPGGVQELAIVNEPGLYSLMLRSRKPQAKAFKRWITHDVIPAIRKTGRYETTPPVEPPKEITAAAGPLPYRDQAELLVILSPVLPEPYATATGKVIMARAMGEAPHLDPSETPLYASTFLAGMGHRPATVAKFQSPFGRRVSDRYFKVHGRRPGKIPGPTGSRIDKVAAYTEDDRPLLEQVYAEMVDAITAFESGGQMAIGA